MLVAGALPRLHRRLEENYMQMGARSGCTHCFGSLGYAFDDGCLRWRMLQGQRLCNWVVAIVAYDFIRLSVAAFEAICSFLVGASAILLLRAGGE